MDEFNKWFDSAVIKEYSVRAVAKAAWQAATQSQRERAVNVAKRQKGSDCALLEDYNKACDDIAAAIRKGE